MTKITQLTDSPISPYRKWYNDWVQQNAYGTVLDVGNSVHWDYGFPTLDINRGKNPTFWGDVENTDFADETFDVVLCNGLYETVNNPQRMIDEVLRITKHIAIFGFVGKLYCPYILPWKFYQGKETFPGGYEIVHYNSDNHYHFIVITKL